MRLLQFLRSMDCLFILTSNNSRVKSEILGGYIERERDVCQVLRMMVYRSEGQYQFLMIQKIFIWSLGCTRVELER